MLTVSRINAQTVIWAWFFIYSNDCCLFHLCSAGSWYFVISECPPLRIWTIFFRISLLLISLLEKHCCLFRFWLAELLGGPFCFVCFQPDVPHRPPAPAPPPQQQQQNQQQLNPTVFPVVMQRPSVARRLLLGFLPVACVRDPPTVCIFLSASLIPITFFDCLSTSVSVYQPVFPSVPICLRLANSVSSYRAFLLDWLLSPFAFCWFKVESIWWSFSAVSRPVLTNEVCSRYIQLPDRTFESFPHFFFFFFFGRL